MLDQKVIDIVKSTVPALKEHGLDITKTFYGLMFKNNPEVKPLFSEDKQKSGEQAKALEKIMPVVTKIGQVHVDSKVKPEHYPVIGKNLLLAIKEVLGDAATDEVLEAWGKAYEVIAEIFIDVEKKLYETA